MKRLIYLYLLTALACNNDIESARYHSRIWYIENTEPMLKAWIDSDTSYFLKYLDNLELENNKNTFYSKLSSMYGRTGSYIPEYNEECQGEKFLIFKDNLIDSDIERMNRSNAVKGMRAYLMSELCFSCVFEKQKVQYIHSKFWRDCQWMNDNDFDSIVEAYNQIAIGLDSVQECNVYYMDTTLTFIRVMAK